MNIDSIPHHIHIERTGHQVTGWLVSCLLHGSLAVATVFFMRHMQLAPQAEPFKWNVAMVAPSPIAAPSTPETSVAPARMETTPPPVPQKSAAPPLTPRSVVELPQPRVATPATPPVTPIIEKPMPSMPATPPPLTAELTPKPPVSSKPEPVVKQPDPVAPPPPPAATSSQNAQTTSSFRAVETALISSPADPTPAASAIPSPHSAPPPPHSTTILAEPMPPAQIDQATTPAEPQANQQPVSAPGSQVAALTSTDQSKPAKVDYGWLSDLMARWIEDLEKRYPAMLRTEGIQGKVTLTALLHKDGMLSDVRVTKSSGNAMLDQTAVEDVRKGPPITLSRPLERPQMPVRFSIIYDLKTAR